MASVLITGTSTGIGLATALTLGRAGHKVYATMRDPSRAPELAEKTAQEKLPIKISVMDVDSDTSVKSAIANIQKDAGQIDVLVNNAGVERNGSIEELPLSEFRAVMETNYFGVIRCIQALVPQMRQRKSGCIINISSVAGHISCPPLAPYTASKFALEALSRSVGRRDEDVQRSRRHRRTRHHRHRHGETNRSSRRKNPRTLSKYALPISLLHPSRTQHSHPWSQRKSAKSSTAEPGNCATP